MKCKIFRNTYVTTRGSQAPGPKRRGSFVTVGFPLVGRALHVTSITVFHYLTDTDTGY